MGIGPILHNEVKALLALWLCLFIQLGGAECAMGNPSVSEIFSQAGVPSWIWQSIEQVESGGNPNAVGDNGTSFGLFQLHWGGLGTGYTSQQLKDPSINASIAAGAMSKAYKAGQAQGLSGYSLLQYTAYNGGWPTKQGVKALSYDPVVQRYDPKLRQAYTKVMGGAGNPSDFAGIPGGAEAVLGGSGGAGSGSSPAPVGFRNQLQALQTAVNGGSGTLNQVGGYLIMGLFAVLGLLLLYQGLKSISGGGSQNIVLEEGGGNSE